MESRKKACTVLLRLLALLATLSAAIVMATDNQTVSFFSTSIHAKFHYSPSFLFFVIANATATIYGLVVLAALPWSSRWQILMAMDLMVTALLIAGASAATAIAYVGKKGNSHAGWLPICDTFTRFCDHVMGALIASFIAIVIHISLLLYAILQSHN